MTTPAQLTVALQAIEDLAVTAGCLARFAPSQTETINQHLTAIAQHLERIAPSADHSHLAEDARFAQATLQQLLAAGDLPQAQRQRIEECLERLDSSAGEA